MIMGYGKARGRRALEDALDTQVPFNPQRERLRDLHTIAIAQISLLELLDLVLCATIFSIFL